MHQYIRNFSQYVGTEVTIKGWVSNKRDSKGIVFLVMRDGSGFAQCVVSQETVGDESFENAKRLTQESAVSLTGTVTQDEKQIGGYELQVKSLEVIFHNELEYPISNKEHGVEFLGKNRHLWLRSRRQWAIMRVRNEVIMGIHDFFQTQGFVQMDAPILTGNACEGTSELFETEFYGAPAYLSQSGQLYGEAMAMAQGLIYTFGPTFRAEKSVTRRHLSEFWMIEPEMAFYNNEMNMNLIEEFIRSVVNRILTRCKGELEVLERNTTMLEKVNSPFPRVAYSEAIKILRGEQDVNGRNSLRMLDEEMENCRQQIEKANAEIEERMKVIGNTNEKAGVRNFNQGKVDKLKQEIADLEEQLRNLPKWRESAANFANGDDFGNSDETVLTRLFDAPVMVYNWPTKIKAFYMKELEGNPEFVKGVDVLAPEGFGEIVGGSERETDINILLKKIEEHGLPQEAFEWYLDLRRFGSVPHAGFGLGLERFVSWMCNIQHIREAIPFQRRYGWLFPCSLRYAPIIFLFLFLFSNAQSQSTYLGYDALDNVAGVSLHGSFGGSGWNAPWNVQGGNPAGYQFSATALNYSNLLTFGGSCDGGQAYLTAGRLLDYDDGGAFDNYVTGSGLIGSTTGTVLYASCLLLKKTNDAERVFLSLHNSNVEWCEGCTSNKISMGYFGASSDVSGVRYWSLQVGSTVYPSTIPVTVGQAVFLVVKISFNAASTEVDLFVNPSSLGIAGEPVVADVSQTTSTLIRIRSTALYLGSTAGRGAADELRFSDSYAVAAPDNTVTLDLPPTGRFTMSQTTGTAPLTVNFDATTSSDPEGNPLTYLWNFGDGSTPVLGSATVSHTYPAGLSGLIPVTLTVSDLSGQQHSPVQVLTLYVSGTSYIPCQSSITSLQEASCNNDNARVRINSGIAVSPQYTFRNALSANMPSTNGNEFHNLAAGNYTITVSGTNQCKDTYTITVQKDSTSCAGWSPSVCAMQMGVNVGGLADWSREHAFVNRYKHVRANIITFHSGSSWDTGMENQLILDADGYPSYIPQSTTANASTRVRFILSSDNGNLKANEQYVFLYDGIGTFNIYGVTVNSNTTGRLLFTVPAVSGNIWIDVNTSQSGNHLRNFRLLKIEDENVDLSVQTFNNVFLSRLSPFKSLRFMDWGHTNASPHIAWANRKTVNERTYSGERGVPYEMMIKLGNEARKDVWICVPHAADEDYITQMATLFKNTLDSDLTIYLEYSNEVWNWMFTQAHYNDDNRPLNLNYGRAYSEKAKRVFQLWYAVFGSESNRVKRVLGLQGGYNSLNESILAQLPQNEWDMAAPSYYFGLDHGATGNPVLNASSTGDNLNTNARNAYFGNWLQYVKQDYRNIRVLGKEIVCYEGGQHYTNFQTVPYQQAMYDAQYLPSMYQLYNDVLDTIRSRGNKLAMAFTLSGLQENFYGSWGHLPDMYMEPPYTLTAPKYQAVLDNSCLPFKSVSAMLPLDLLSFEAYSLNQKDIDVVWKVSNERDILYYEIERSANAIDFIKIETQEAYNTSENKIYKTTDFGLASGTYYYRLKIVEKNGSYRYSPIVAVKLSNNSSISVFPNPCHGVFHIASLPESSEVRLFDLFGRLVKEYPQSTKDFDTTDLPVGLYVLKIKENSFLLQVVI